MAEEGEHDSQITDLEQLLDRIRDAAGSHEEVSLGAILNHLGSRSFGPLLLLAGLITLAPVIGDIPGVPTLMALIVILIAAQLLVGRDHLWLPPFLLRRSITREKVDRALAWVQRPARGIDRLVRPRLHVFVGGWGVYAVALACLLIGLAMPPMELVPFSANGAGLALTAFGLGLIAKDGLLSLCAFIVTFATLGAVAYGLL